MKETILPATLWGEAVRHSVYVLNRLPTRALSSQTPYEAWTGNKPNLSHIRVFGCLTHMKIPNIHTKKLDDKSLEVINLGREPGTKAYRVYDPVSKHIHVTRDVIFEETKGWSSLQQGKIDDCDAGSFSVPEILEKNDLVQDDVEQAYGEETRGSVFETPPHSPVSGTSDTGGSTLSHTPLTGVSAHIYDDSGEPRRYKLIGNVYNDTEEIELDQELLFVAAEEPQSYEQAAKEKNWRLAMDKEIESIEKNGTWKLARLPDGHKTIGLKWVYKLKKDASGNIVKHKARLVAKGYVQEHGIDYDEVYAPVTRLEIVRLLLALAAKNNWQVHHLDVKTAFLNGDINEEVYVAQPKGYVKKGQEQLVYKLFKALYGLKQAATCLVCKVE